jgi:hypothetical protein
MREMYEVMFRNMPGKEMLLDIPFDMPQLIYNNWSTVIPKAGGLLSIAFNACTALFIG